VSCWFTDIDIIVFLSTKIPKKYSLPSKRSTSRGFSLGERLVIFGPASRKIPRALGRILRTRGEFSRASKQILRGLGEIPRGLGEFSQASKQIFPTLGEIFRESGGINPAEKQFPRTSGQILPGPGK
jgi:hypothetical protein